LLDDASYLEKVYAGVLGKMIGVYLGRPVEGWSYERISTTIGFIDTYVHERLGLPLIVADDDLSGTFTFLRAVEDYGFPRRLRAEEIGRTWLNYLVEGRTILWWGGRGNSTEHTAYLNLREGVPAPESGSSHRNGAVVANQIGAMIFIDGWAMLHPGSPALAAEAARTAASVSHDAEALDAAAFIAAMEAAAFESEDLEALWDAGLGVVPGDSAIAAIAREVRETYLREPDWRVARAWLDGAHGYRRYPGSCHVMPNFGLILLAFLYGRGDFRTSLAIAVSSGWDTDCNAANLGCLLGIRGGLAAIDSCPDLRLPPRDRIFISSADGGRSITDAAREALAVAGDRARVEGRPVPSPKGGARFSFELPGSVHGFGPALDEGGRPSSARIRNALLADAGCAAGDPRRALEVSFAGGGQSSAISTPVFVPPDYDEEVQNYGLEASPTLYPGQRVTCRIAAPRGNPRAFQARLFAGACGKAGGLGRHRGEWTSLAPGESGTLEWRVDLGEDYPAFELGLEFRAEGEGEFSAFVDSIDWRGAPEVQWRREGRQGLWVRAWVRGVDQWATQFAESFRLSQNRGVGLLLQGAREWGDYRVSSPVSLYCASEAGIVARARGLRRYYGLVLCREGRLRLLRVLDETSVLAELPFSVEEAREYRLELTVRGRRIVAAVDGRGAFDLEDDCPSLSSGAAGFLVEEGTLVSDLFSVAPLGRGS